MPPMISPLRKTVGMKVPITEPTIEPMPPKRLVSPMTTAETALRLSAECDAVDAVAKRATSNAPRM